MRLECLTGEIVKTFKYLVKMVHANPVKHWTNQKKEEKTHTQTGNNIKTTHVNEIIMNKLRKKKKQEEKKPI